MTTEIMILAASPGKRMRTAIPKSLLLLRKETILSRQIKLIEQCFPKSTVKVIVGFKSTKVIQHLRSLETNLHIIPCLIKDYDDTCPAKAIAAYRDSRKDALIINGDLTFSSDLLNIEFDDTGIISTKRYIERNDVGFSDVDGYAGFFAYGFAEKYGQIAYLTKRDADIFSKLASIKKNKNLLNFELFNLMIAEGVYFKIYRPKNGKILDVDKISDLEMAVKIV